MSSQSSDTEPSKVNQTASGVLGSITGQRLDSGTVSGIEARGSFELRDRVVSEEFKTVASASRERANTAPPNLQDSTVLEQKKVTKTEEDSHCSEEDDELKLAKAMALAIESKPNMTPDEIRQLVANMQTGIVPQQQQQQQTQPKTVLAASQRFATMFQSAVDSAATTASTAVAANQTNFRNLGENLRSQWPIIKPPTAVVQQDTKASDAPVPTRRNASITAATNATSGTHSLVTPKESTMPKRRSFRASKISPRSPPVEGEPSTNRPTTPTIEAVPVKTSPASQGEEPRPRLQSDVSAVSSEPESGPKSILSKLPVIGAGARTNNRPKSAVIRLSGLAWKRRGGMGKFSSTSAWELRRIELAGTKLFYFSNENGDELDQSLNKGSSKEEMVSEADAFSELIKDEEGVVVTKRTNWFEQAAANWTVNATTMDPTAPRGYIDLAKEKATVHAAFGHSGAPSPFAISIKVRIETRWKLCFDHHNEMMEWLAALTDVVVQSSVDTYNAQLLAAADPSSLVNQIDAGPLLHPPGLKEPPTTGAEAGIHRLWMLSPYKIESNFGSPVVPASSDDEVLLEGEFPRSVAVEDDVALNPDVAASSLDRGALAASIEDHSVAQEAAKDEAEKTWFVPEENLQYLFGILNVALGIARASSTPIEGFWYLVVLANLGMFLCLVKEPHWRSILLHVREVKLVPGAPLFGQKALLKKKAPVAPIVPKKPGFLPIAGSTTVKLKAPTDVPENSKNQVFGGWCSPPGEILQVRSYGYSTTKAKVSSPGELYKCVHVDIFESPQRYPDMATRVKLPSVTFDDGGKKKTWRSPDIFIVSIALPTDPPKIGRSSSDGGGYTVTMYFAMHSETREILRRVTAEDYDATSEIVPDPQTSKVNAVRLFEEWCRRAPSDPKFMSRFKVVPNAHNLKDIGMPAWIAKYNGKPFLIKRPGQTGFLYSHPELSCMEFDISLHPFPYLAKQGICFMKENFFKKILVTFGFVIEGRSDDELPECVIGLMQLCYPDPQYAIQASSFFAGTAPKSYE